VAEHIPSTKRVKHGHPLFNLVRKIIFYVVYDTKKKQLVSTHQYKYEVPRPAKGSGKVVVKVRGLYSRGEIR